MIVISRNGKTTVITGWRAWLIGAATVLLITVVLALIFVLVLGAAVTLALFLSIAVPVAIGVALIASLFRPRA